MRLGLGGLLITIFFNVFGKDERFLGILDIFGFNIFGNFCGIENGF